MKLITSLLFKFKNAFSGIFVVLKDETSLIIEICIAIVAVALGIIFKLSENQWAIVIILIALVFTFEIINTGIEHLLDTITFKYNLKVKKIKDIFAGATLVFSIGCLISGLLIYVPAIIAYANR